jgi:predicted metal-dependent phosphoesterase TrpH
MKCDLHVHSVHSGMCTTPLFRRFCRESYSRPEEVYSRLKQKGMDLVTLTDHDSIGGAEALRRYPDFFMSEEVTCRMPSGTEVHVGVFDITERQHQEIQRRRQDLPALLAYLTERRLLFGINHVFSALTGRREIADFSWFGTYFPAIETRNGQMPQFHNRCAAEWAERHGKIETGGSDSHALPSLGTAYTEVPGARNKAEFLAGLRSGKALIRGQHGSYGKLTRDILWIAAGMLRQDPCTWPLVFLVPFVPLATLASALLEATFARLWSSRVAEALADCETGLFGPPAEPREVFAWP